MTVNTMKMTPQRLAVLQYLNGNTQHPSAEEIYRAVSLQYPTMSFATVYNTLETLRKAGTIQELWIDPLRKRFDPNPLPHNHVICIQCKKIVDVAVEQIMELPAKLSEEFEIVSSQLTFFGICSACKKQ
jgi:Fur family peroxide stress response transcriptional regulator